MSENTFLLHPCHKIARGHQRQCIMIKEPIAWMRKQFLGHRINMHHHVCDAYLGVECFLHVKKPITSIPAFVRIFMFCMVNFWWFLVDNDSTSSHCHNQLHHRIFINFNALWKCIIYDRRYEMRLLFQLYGVRNCTNTDWGKEFLLSLSNTR